MVLGFGENAGKGALGKHLVVQVQILDDVADEGLLIVLVVDGEAPVVPQGVDLHGEEPGAKSMEGEQPHTRLLAGELLHPFLHLPSGLVGEGQGQDMVGRHAFFRDQVCDAGGQHPGFAAAGPGQHQQGTFRAGDRLPLRGIQFRQIYFHSATSLSLSACHKSNHTDGCFAFASSCEWSTILPGRPRSCRSAAAPVRPPAP